jgi:hypothetical protein
MPRWLGAGRTSRHRDCLSTARHRLEGDLPTRSLSALTLNCEKAAPFSSPLFFPRRSRAANSSPPSKQRTGAAPRELPLMPHPEPPPLMPPSPELGARKPLPPSIQPHRREPHRRASEHRLPATSIPLSRRKAASRVHPAVRLRVTRKDVARDASSSAGGRVRRAETAPHAPSATGPRPLLMVRDGLRPTVSACDAKWAVAWIRPMRLVKPFHLFIYSIVFDEP